jgi:glycosyltransferase involved in cell wall biosynthesis
MRIGVDATCWANQRGYGRFTRELVTALVREAPGDEFVCLLDARAREVFTLDAPNVSPVVVRQRVSPVLAASANGYRSPVDMLRFSGAVRRTHPAVFFFPAQYSFFPVPPRVRMVVTFHDVIAERFPELTLPSRRARLFWRAKTWLALRQCRLVLAVSEYTADELVRVLAVPRAKIRVTSEAPASAYKPSDSPDQIAAAASRAGVSPGARWFIYVGGFSPHKHVDVIVRAHAAVARGHAGDPPHLVLVGALTGDGFLGAQDRIRQEIAAQGTERLVHWAGRVPDDELRHLHSGAVAQLLPSASEGFGLPSVEAAACGTPVIATRESPLPRLLEGGGLFVAPGDGDALQRALLAMLTDEGARRRMGATARQRAHALTWRAAAVAALAAIREAAA